MSDTKALKVNVGKFTFSFLSTCVFKLFPVMAKRRHLAVKWEYYTKKEPQFQSLTGWAFCIHV